MSSLPRLLCLERPLALLPALQWRGETLPVEKVLSSLGIIMAGDCTATLLCSCCLDWQSLLFAPWDMAALVSCSQP